MSQLTHVIKYLVAMAICLATVSMTASAAHAASTSAYNESGCLGGDKKLKGNFALSATDQGSSVAIGTTTRATVYLQNCAENASRYGNLELSFEIIAYGWGLDGCGVSVPASAGCSGSSTRKSFEISGSASNSSSISRYISSPGWGFRDGSVGDTTRVCAVVRGAVNGYWAVTVGEGCVTV